MRPAWLPFVVLTLIPRVGAPQGDPVGPEFRVNTYTTDYQRSGSVAGDSSGNFVVIWESRSQDGSTWGIFGQRYAASGVPLGSEFRVNSYTTSYQWISDVASDSRYFILSGLTTNFSAAGLFASATPARRSSRSDSESRVPPFQTNLPSYLATPPLTSCRWASQYRTARAAALRPRYDSTVTPLVRSSCSHDTTSNHIDRPSRRLSGNFGVVWERATQDGSVSGVFGQRYASTGVSLSSEFRVNT